MADAQLLVDPRMVTGKKVKSLRKEGIIPAHLYGRDTESLAVQTQKQSMLNLLRSAGPNALIDLQISGESESRPVVLRGVQRHPVTGELVHIDFMQISLTEKLRTEVPLVITGDAPAVSVQGGVLLQMLDRLLIESLPGDVPQHVEVDVSGLEELDSTIFVRDLLVPASIQVQADPDQPVAKVAAPRLAQELEAEEAAAAEAAAEAAPEEGEEPEAAAEEEGEEPKSE